MNTPSTQTGPQNIVLRRRTYSLEATAKQNTNFLHAFQHEVAAVEFRQSLWKRRALIAATIRHHLRLNDDDDCHVLPTKTWIQGGFNLCVLARVRVGQDKKRIVFRCPMPHKVAEHHYPGSIDEKLNAEVATYLYIQRNCSDIPIPQLYAFGFADRTQFTHADQTPLQTSANHPLPSTYTRDTSAPSAGTAFLLLEYIGPDNGKGNLLTFSWNKHLHDTARRARLFHSIARIMISLARFPQPQIGSLGFNTTDESISLSNRPLMANMVIWENEGTQRVVQPNQLYRSTDTFASDMLALYDNHFRHDKHAVRDEDDARHRIAIRVLLRAVMHHFILPDHRDGPFLLQMTDLSHSNLFVDEDWNITCLIDLEWICALPVDILAVPYWLTNCAVDTVHGDAYLAFDKVRQDFLTILEDEEERTTKHHNISMVGSMKQTWDSKGVWFWESMQSINAFPVLFHRHILPKFSSTKALLRPPLVGELAKMWQADDLDQFVTEKVSQEVAYQAELRTLFENEEREVKAQLEKTTQPDEMVSD